MAQATFKIGDWVRHTRFGNMAVRIVKDEVLSNQFPTKGRPTGLLLGMDYDGNKWFVDPRAGVWELDE